MIRLYHTVKALLESETGRVHPVQVLARFGYLQLRRRIGPAPFVFSTPSGTRALVDRRGDFTGVTHLFYFGLPDLEATAFACHTLRPGETFWDVGANQGFWSLLLAGRGADAHAFEPTPSTFANLTRQFAAQAPEHRQRLHAHNLAAASQTGRLRFVVDSGQTNHLLTPDEPYDGAVSEVSVTTLDELGKRLGSPQFIKIDVEGWTLPVLEGASAILARRDLLGLVIETFRSLYGETAEARRAEELLADHGFRPFAYDPKTRKLRALTRHDEGQQDTVYAREDERLRERLRTAAPVVRLGDAF